MKDIYKVAKVELLRHIEERFRAAYNVDLQTLNEFLIRNYEFTLKEFVAQEAPKNDPIMMAAGLHLMVMKMIDPTGKPIREDHLYKPNFTTLSYESIVKTKPLEEAEQ